ncbi:MAG: nuclear transport factor 2 family protein [Halieaceae bacterium]
MQPEREIENLIYRYAELIDAGDLEAVAALFTHASIVAPDGSQCRGYDAVLAMYRDATRIYPDSATPCTQHLTSNLLIEVDEDRASADSRFTVFQALPDFPLQAIIAGRYRDRFERVAGCWRFAQREIQPQLFGDLSRHLLFDADRIK